MKNDIKQRQAAKKFVEYWTFQRGSEKGEDQRFWNMLLRDVLGMEDVEQRTHPQVSVQMGGTTKFLDLWIPETKVLVEHKSRESNSATSASLRLCVEKITQTAQSIVDARAKYPDATLAQMYGDKMYLFPELVAAHEANDRAVLAAYGLAPDTPEPEIVAHLFKLYAALGHGR